MNANEYVFVVSIARKFRNHIHWTLNTETSKVCLISLPSVTLIVVGAEILEMVALEMTVSMLVCIYF